MSPSFLITGFEPFGGEKINPSQKILDELQIEFKNEPRFRFELLPVDYEKAQMRMREILREHKPAIWLGMGQAGGRSKINLERIAVNWKEAEGFQPEILRPEGVAAFFNSLDLKQLQNHLSDQSIPSEISVSAGAYICNAVYYTWFEECPKSKGLFVHLPYLPEQHQDKPNMELSLQLKAIKLLIEKLELFSGHDGFIRF